MQLGVIQRGNPLGKTGKGLSWQGEEHAKLEMREFRDRVIVIIVRFRYTVLRIPASFHSNLSLLVLPGYIHTHNCSKLLTATVH